MIVYKVCGVDEDGKRVSLYPFGRILEYPEGVDIVPVEGDGPIYAYDSMMNAVRLLYAGSPNDVEVWECDANLSRFDRGWYITEWGTKVQPTYSAPWQGSAVVMCDSVRLTRCIGSRVNGRIMEREEATV